MIQATRQHNKQQASRCHFQQHAKPGNPTSPRRGLLSTLATALVVALSGAFGLVPLTGAATPGEPQAPCPMVNGDLNDDGLLNIMDLMLLVKVVAGVEAAPPAFAPPCPQVYGDFNNDGMLGPGDLLVFTKMVVSSAAASNALAAGAEDGTTSYPWASLDEYYDAIDHACESDKDCSFQNEGNCCGYSPVCASTASVTAPQWVAQHCAENGIVSVCGFPAAVTSCQCVEGTCTTS